MKKMVTCLHKVQYYETDQMQVVHHSNYIRWFEEGRVVFMESFGLGYDKMEELGIISPVLEVSAKYIHSVSFGKTVVIKTFVKEYKGLRLTVGYQVYEKETNTLCCTGETKHCFLNSKGTPILLKKELPEFHKMFEESSLD